jgi:hypothetical protein
MPTVSSSSVGTRAGSGSSVMARSKSSSLRCASRSLSSSRILSARRQSLGQIGFVGCAHVSFSGGRAIQWMCGVVRAISRKYRGERYWDWDIDDDDP